MNQTDQRAGAKEVVFQISQIDAGYGCCLTEGAIDLIAQALADAERRGMERAAKEVPTNWCDPLLTGPKGIANAGTAFTCRSIEQLLRGIQDRIRAQAQADKEG